MCEFNSRKQEQITRDQIRGGRRLGDHGQDFSGQKLPQLTQQSEPALCHGASTSPVSAIIPDVFDGLAPSDVAMPYGLK